MWSISFCSHPYQNNKWPKFKRCILDFIHMITIVFFFFKEYIIHRKHSVIDKFVSLSTLLSKRIFLFCTVHVDSYSHGKNIFRQGLPLISATTATHTHTKKNSLWSKHFACPNNEIMKPSNSLATIRKAIRHVMSIGMCDQNRERSS